ncbi:hypothetical protein BDD12DRAFT_186208 [Trichophaea hybrida]|nr:hypothetical protein BDD12DRAFT_186208 [Trichophaea hybrida]
MLSFLASGTNHSFLSKTRPHSLFEENPSIVRRFYARSPRPSSTSPPFSKTENPNQSNQDAVQACLPCPRRSCGLCCCYQLHHHQHHQHHHHLSHSYRSCLWCFPPRRLWWSLGCCRCRRSCFGLVNQSQSNSLNSMMTFGFGNMGRLCS